MSWNLVETREAQYEVSDPDSYLDFLFCWIYDENPRDSAHDFRLMGATFKGKMNQTVTETLEPNLWGSHRISNFVPTVST